MTSPAQDEGLEAAARHPGIHTEYRTYSKMHTLGTYVVFASQIRQQTVCCHSISLDLLKTENGIYSQFEGWE